MHDEVTRKSELRKAIRAKKHEHSQKYFEECSASICSQILHHKRMAKAHIVLAYYSLSDEVNTHQLIDTLLEMGKVVLLPKVIGDGIMELRRYESASDLKVGSFNIMEPTGSLFTDYGKIEIAIVPGMAFDRENNRMGRGKGFYDRLLPKMNETYKIGVCFPFQLIDHVPTNDFDIKMDEVITGSDSVNVSEASSV